MSGFMQKYCREKVLWPVDDQKNESLLIIPLVKSTRFCRDRICFLSVDFKLQMLMQYAPYEVE